MPKHFDFDRDTKRFSILFAVVAVLATTAAFLFAFPANAQEENNSVAAEAITEALKEGQAIFIPEDGRIACTLDKGCVEVNGTIDFYKRNQMEAQPLLLGAARGMLLERAQAALEAVKALSPQQLLSEELARAIVRDFRSASAHGATWAAREHVFVEHQCDIFAHYNNPSNACWAVRAFEGSDAEHRGIPAEVMPAIRDMRKVLFATGRNFMKDPKNLRNLYGDTKPAMVDEFNQLFFQPQQDFVNLLDKAMVTLAEYQNPEVKEGLSKLYDAERDHRYKVRETAYEDLQAAKAALDELVTDIEFVQFWHRRHAEGGPLLLEAYAESISDLRETLRPQAILDEGAPDSSAPGSSSGLGGSFGTN